MLKDNEIILINKLLKKINYKDNYLSLNNPTLFLQALTHSSYSRENNTFNNEILEFIGDEILDSCLTRILFRLFIKESEEHFLVSSLDEGDLSIIKQMYVSGKYLTKIAKELELDQLLLIGESGKKQKIEFNDKLLENLVESIIASVALDTAYDESKNFNLCSIDYAFLDKFITKFLKINTDEILEFVKNKKTIFPINPNDPKTTLNHLFTSGKIKKPEYKFEEFTLTTTGQSLFKISVSSGDFVYASEKLRFKKNEGEKSCALHLLKILLENLAKKENIILEIKPEFAPPKPPVPPHHLEGPLHKDHLEHHPHPVPPIPNLEQENLKLLELPPHLKQHIERGILPEHHNMIQVSAINENLFDEDNNLSINQVQKYLIKK